MNKIERAIADLKQHIQNLETEKTLIYAELNAYKKQLDNLEAIERNDAIPHFEQNPASSPFNPEIMLYGDIQEVPNTKHTKEVDNESKRNLLSSNSGRFKKNQIMEEKTFTTEEVIVLLKAFHLDSVEGRYNKELLDWCNNWVNYNIKETIDFETYMKNSKQK